MYSSRGDEGMEISLQHLTGILATLVLVLFMGHYSGKKVKTSKDFSVTNRQAGSILVAGTIMGTLVGGASTIGTAQLAFMYGFSAWWFTLGGGIACFFLGVFLAAPTRRKNFETVPCFLKEEYGDLAAVFAVLFASLGIFVNIIPQIMSSTALLLSMFSLSAWMASLIAVLLMIAYVLFGGVWGTGLIGTTKIILTYVSLMVGGALALKMMGGISGLTAAFPAYPWFSLFGRGVNQDLAAAFSLIVGVLSSQIYFQAVFSAKDVKNARNGALISAVMGPVIGLAGIVIGMLMRAHHPDIIPAQALPLFVLNYLNPWFGGVVQATLLLAAIGTGAGLALGVSTMFCRDLYQKFYPNADDGKVLLFFRIFIIVVLVLALAIIYISGGNGIILQWSYLSLGVRGATIFFPLMAALYLKGKVTPQAGTAAIFAGPASVILGGLFLPWDLNPLYLGLAVSLAIILVGYLCNYRQVQKLELLRYHSNY
jgi:SSS family solute:Na+ symporter